MTEFEKRFEWHWNRISNQGASSLIIDAMHDAYHLMKILDNAEPVTFNKKLKLATLILELNRNETNNED